MTHELTTPASVRTYSGLHTADTTITAFSCSNSCLGRFDSKDEAILIYLATRQDRIYQGVPLTETFLGSETDINQSGREISKWINQPFLFLVPMYVEGR